jgi:hypothetical protein
VQTKQFQPSPHGPHARLVEEILSVETMLLAETLWEQHFDISPKHLFPLISEQLLGLGVNDHNLAVLIHHNHSVWGRV